MQWEEWEKGEWVFCDPTITQETSEAFDNALEYWRKGQFDQAEILLRSFIDKNPRHIDAFHHLSLLFEETSRELEAYLCCREATRIGLSALPEKFNWKKSRIEWLALENRPFMRAYHNLGLWYIKRSELDAAITVYSRLLAVCPNDNLGVRYLLPELWLEKGDVLSIVRHCKAYADDGGPEIAYTYPLALILLGEVDKAKPLLVSATNTLPLVAKELKKKRHTRPKSSWSGGITWGGADQAYEYWRCYGKYWAGSESAMKMLSTL